MKRTTRSSQGSEKSTTTYGRDSTRGNSRDSLVENGSPHDKRRRSAPDSSGSINYALDCVPETWTDVNFGLDVFIASLNSGLTGKNLARYLNMDDLKIHKIHWLSNNYKNKLSKQAKLVFKSNHDARKCIDTGWFS